MSLTVKDLEQLQQQHPDYSMELVGGEIVVMSPSGLESDEVALEIADQLRNWVRPRRLGRVFGSSGSFVLPNADEDVRAPDAAFVKAEQISRKFPANLQENLQKSPYLPATEKPVTEEIE